MPKKRGSRMKRSRRKRSRKTSRKKNKQRSRKMKKRNMKGGKGLFDYVPDFLKAKPKPKTEINEPQKGSLPGPDGTCPPQKGLITKAGDFFGKGIGEATGLVGKAGGAITSVTQDMTKKTSGVIKGQLDGLTVQLQKVNKNMFQQAADTGICPCCGQKLPDKKEDLQKDVKQLEQNLAQVPKPMEPKREEPKKEEEVKTDKQMAAANAENIILKIDDKNDNGNKIETISLDSLNYEN